MDWIGLLLWVLIFYPCWSPRCRRIRKAQKSRVSRNPSTTTHPTIRLTGTGPAWEQDSPYPECFVDLDESEL